MSERAQMFWCKEHTYPLRRTGVKPRTASGRTATARLCCKNADELAFWY